MNESALALRLIWKEFRTQTSFFVSVGISSVLFQGLFRVLSTHTETSDWAMICIALVMPCLYAVGAAGTAFAGEREEGTDRFLRLRGVPYLPFWTSKFVFLAGTMLLMSGVLWLSAGMLGTDDVAEIFYRYLPRGLCLSIQLLAWGILMSMLSSTALFAVVCAVVAFIVTVTIVTMASPEEFSPIHYFITVALLAIDIAVTDYWLRTEPGRITGWWQRIRASRPRVDHRRQWRWRFKEAATPARRMWQRLCWLERQESRFLFGVIVLQCLLTMGSVLTTRDSFGFVCGGMLFLLFYTPFHSGLRVFRAEQQQSRFRFFHDRGVSPSWLWFSKQTVWMTKTIITTALLYFATWLVLSANRQTDHIPAELWTSPNFPGGIVIATLLAYGIGQLCSLLFARAVIAWFMGLVFAGIVVMWWHEVAFLQGSLFFVLAIWLWTLIVSYVCIGDWLSERHGGVARIRLAGAVLIPTVLLSTAWAVSRVQSIPASSTARLEQVWHATGDSNGGGIEAALQSAHEKLLGHENRSAFQQVGSLDGAPPMWSDLTMEQQNFVIDNENVVRDLVSAANQVSTAGTSQLTNGYLDTIRTLLCCDARRLEADGELKAALERYLAVLKIARLRAQGQMWWKWRELNLHQMLLMRWLPGWVNADRQNSASVGRGLNSLTEEWERFPSASTALNNTLLVQWHELQDQTQLRNWPVAQVPKRYSRNPFLGDVRGQVYMLMPFEVARAERIFLRRTASLFEQLQREKKWIEFAAGAGDSLLALDFEASPTVIVGDDTVHEWLESSPLADDLAVPKHRDVLNHVTNREMVYRMSVIAIWLTDKARETGRYPDTLTEVAYKLSTTMTPSDPWTSEDFLYYPQGILKDSLMRHNRLWNDYSDPPLITSRGFRLPSETRRTSSGSFDMNQLEGDVVNVHVPLWPTYEAPNAITLPPVASGAGSL